MVNKESKSKEVQLNENDILIMIDETSKLVSKLNLDKLSKAIIEAKTVNTLTNNVEFWKWMNRNYEKSGIFNSVDTMRDYLKEGLGNEEWFRKQIQGKGYEFDWITRQRENFKKIFNIYDAGDVANRVGSDVTEKNIITGKTNDYQMKAYTSKTNPQLKNTAKEMTVVTNSEKVEIVKSNGYNKVESFENNEKIKKATDKRMDDVKTGKVATNYNIRNVGGVMAKAGIIGCAIGIGIETVSSYKSWKEGKISDEEYLLEIFKAGGEAGITSGISAGIMVPVSATIATAGASILITMPIAFIIGGAINKVIAPCFGRGEYRKILKDAKYYQDVQSCYSELIIGMEKSSNEYYDYFMYITKQREINSILNKKSREIDKELKNLFDSI